MNKTEETRLERLTSSSIKNLSKIAAKLEKEAYPMSTLDGKEMLWCFGDASRAIRLAQSILQTANFISSKKKTPKH